LSSFSMGLNSWLQKFTIFGLCSNLGYCPRLNLFNPWRPRLFWTRCSDTPKIKDDGSSSWKWVKRLLFSYRSMPWWSWLWWWCGGCLWALSVTLSIWLGLFVCIKSPVYSERNELEVDSSSPFRGPPFRARTAKTCSRRCRDETGYLFACVRQTSCITHCYSPAETVSRVTCDHFMPFTSDGKVEIQERCRASLSSLWLWFIIGI